MKVVSPRPIVYQFQRKATHHSYLATSQEQQEQHRRLALKIYRNKLLLKDNGEQPPTVRDNDTIYQECGSPKSTSQVTALKSGLKASQNKKMSTVSQHSVQMKGIYEDKQMTANSRFRSPSKISLEQTELLLRRKTLETSGGHKSNNVDLLPLMTQFR